MGDGNGNKAGRQQRGQGPRVVRTMMTAMRMAGNKEGEGGNAMATATRVAGKQMATATKKGVAMKTREVGKDEDNGKGGKSNGNNKEKGNGKEDGRWFSSFDFLFLH